MVAGTLALVVTIGLVAAWDLYRVRSDLEAGRRALDDLTLEVASSEGLAGVTADAAGHLRRASERAHESRALSVLGLLPTIDDQIDGIRRLTTVTNELGVSALQAAERLDRELDRAREPAGRIALLEVALDEMARIDAELAEVDLGSPEGLLGPLRRAHADLVASVESARTKLTEGRELVAPVRDMLVGPTHYLLLAANNAEMAGGAGLALSAGVLSFNDGDIELGDVIAASDLRLDAAVDVPSELAAIYSPTGVGIDFRSSTRSPNLPAMGPVIAAMVDARAEGEIDGVVVVDAVALSSLLALTGSVEVDDQLIHADNVLAEVLNENYKAFDDLEERPERVSYQGDIAKAIFDAVTERDVDAAQLVDALLDAGKGRHLMLWASRPELQDVWEDLAIAGELHEHGLMVSFQNYSANKMDWYLRPTAALDVGLVPNGDYRARLTMQMAVPPLTDIPDASPYILGPTPELQGLFLTAHLPASAYDITTTHERGFRTRGTDGPMQVRTFLVDVPLGTTVERTIEFTLPREDWAMVLLPSARVVPMPLTIDGTTVVTDAQPTFITWEAAVPATAGSSGVRLPVQALIVLGLGLNAIAAALVAASQLPVGAHRPHGSWLAVAKMLVVAAPVAFVAAGALAFLLSIPRV